jgi:hypothetical protein
MSQWLLLLLDWLFKLVMFQLRRKPILRLERTDGFPVVKVLAMLLTEPEPNIPLPWELLLDPGAPMNMVRVLSP